MTNRAADPTATRVTWALMTVFFASLGWYTLWHGGIELAGKSGRTSFVAGPTGLLVAFGAFGIASAGLLLVTKTFDMARRGQVIAVVCLLLPPILYVAAGIRG